jgi:uncharacterized protein YqjF (DUF2071 family)
MLDEYIPGGLEADTIDGNAFVSLVAFDFNDTCVKGMKIPFHINFPEINLRFYVKEKSNKNQSRRGVVFIREFVPKFFISLVANKVYNENYTAIDMSSRAEKNGKISINHTIKLNGKEYNINAEADNKSYVPPVDSAEHFFKEHEWGFGVNKRGETLIYRVQHPVWEIYPLTNIEHNFDFGVIYGNKWKSLNDDKPYNFAFAKGSEVKVYKGNLLEIVK